MVRVRQVGAAATSAFLEWHMIQKQAAYEKHNFKYIHTNSKQILIIYLSLPTRL